MVQQPSQLKTAAGGLTLQVLVVLLVPQRNLSGFLQLQQDVEELSSQLLPVELLALSSFLLCHLLLLVFVSVCCHPAILLLSHQAFQYGGFLLLQVTGLICRRTWRCDDSGLLGRKQSLLPSKH